MPSCVWGAWISTDSSKVTSSRILVTTEGARGSHLCSRGRVTLGSNKEDRKARSIYAELETASRRVRH